MCDISQKLDEGKEVDAIFLDFSKAFDKVDHMKLLYKLDRIGVSKQVQRWVQSLLVGRSINSGCRWLRVQLMSSNIRSTSRFSYRPDTVPCLYQRPS